MPSHPDLLVGADTGDDAAVWRLGPARALITTADFFTPIVDDARTWGRISAANSCSDVYAMGGTPLVGINLVAWPVDRLPIDLMGDVLAGGAEIAEEGGWVVAGGHTVDGPEPMYGQSIIGEVDPDAVLTNATAGAGEALVLTKAIGTGLLATAVKRSDASAIAPGGPLADLYQAAVSSMTTLNADGARVALAHRATACTDVTGFGLLGHLHRMAEVSGVAAVVEVERVPVLDGAWELLDAGFVPGGTERNAAYVEPTVDLGGRPNGKSELTMLADAQTSGGLVFSCPPEAASDAVAELRALGLPAAEIGRTVEGAPGHIQLA